MKSKKTGQIKLNDSAMRVGKIVSILLFVAFLGNFIVDGWNWGAMDFVIVGLLLFVAGMGFDWVGRKISNPFYRLLASLSITALLLLVWSELAVDAVSKFTKLIF